MPGLGTVHNHPVINLLQMSLLTYGNEAAKKFAFLENTRRLVSRRAAKVVKTAPSSDKTWEAVTKRDTCGSKRRA